MFADRLKKLRIDKKLSQQQMADFLGISRQGYGKYEKNDDKNSSQPDFDTLKKLSDFFDVSIDYLITGRVPEETVTDSGREIHLSTEELKIFEELKKHPILFNDLASDPEKKIKELIKLYKMKKMFLEDDEEEYGDGFGDIED